MSGSAPAAATPLPLAPTRALPPAFVRAFERAVEAARRGPRYVSEDSVEPVTEIPPLPPGGAPAEPAELARTVFIKLNGGQGTTMGMRAPKGLLHAADGMTFLDIALKQAETVGATPLLMNSFATDRAVRAALGDRRVGFLVQHRAPKLRQSDLTPVRVPEAPALEWCPPGHADLYTALGTTGRLERFLARGYRYAFLSNIDNVGGAPDPRILGHFIRSGAPFLMEAVRRTAADWKGGQIVRRRADGRLILRETAQCDPADARWYQDTERHRYSNTNNLWLRLDALAEALERGGGFLPLPTILNPKTVDPHDPASTPVFHLEQAAGSAIEAFADPVVVEVSRGRFAAVKTTAHLLILRSDLYEFDAGGRVSARRETMPPVDLDPAHYRFIQDLESRFPHGPPSLVACDRLRVEGDVRFGERVVCEGEVEITARPGVVARIPDGARLTGSVEF